MSWIYQHSSGATETRQNEQKRLPCKQNTQGHCQSSDAAALSFLKQLSTTRKKYIISCKIMKADGVGQGNTEMCYSSSNLLGTITWEETVGAICSRNTCGFSNLFRKPLRQQPGRPTLGQD